MRRPATLQDCHTETRIRRRIRDRLIMQKFSTSPPPAHIHSPFPSPRPSPPNEKRAPFLILTGKTPLFVRSSPQSPVIRPQLLTAKNLFPPQTTVAPGHSLVSTAPGPGHPGAKRFMVHNPSSPLNRYGERSLLPGTCARSRAATSSTNSLVPITPESVK